MLAACAPERHVGRGAIVEIDPDGMGVTIEHDEIAGLMPAMRMHFPARDETVLRDAVPGREVRFTLTRRGEELSITALETLGGPPTPRPGIHDHTPHHGGVVTMIGLRHLEATASADGQLRVYVTDVWRRPVALTGWTGEATLQNAAGDARVELAPGGDALEGHGAALAGASALAHVRIVPPGEPAPLEANLTLPLVPGGTGTAVAPTVRCTPDTLGDLPNARCVLDFGEPVTTLAALPSSPLVVLGITNAGVSIWNLDDGSLVRAFDAPPVVGAPAAGAPHVAIVDALVSAPDGSETIVAHEGRLLRYATDTGRVLRILTSPTPLPRAIVWPSATRTLLVQGAGARDIWRLEARNGARAATVGFPSPVTAIAADAGTTAVGTDAGEVFTTGVDAGDPRRRHAAVPRPVRDLALAEDHLVVATGAGTIETLDRTSGARLAATAAASPCYRIVASAQRGLVACAAFDHTVRVSELTSGEVVETFAGHGALVQALAFGAPGLVSADAAGRVIRWELPDRRP